MLNALGYLAILGCLLTLGFLLIVQSYSFLAVNAPVQADTLVVEGWLPDYALEQVVAEFQQGNYQTIVVLGEPLQHGYFLSQYKSYAHLAAATLIFLGIAPEKIVAVPVPHVDRDRTQTAALAFKHWLSVQKKTTPQAINLHSLGPHARRSWLLFRQVMPELQIGIITAVPRDYQPNRWWDYSSGVRSVLSEAIGYGYACLPRPIPPLPQLESVEGLNAVEGLNVKE